MGQGDDEEKQRKSDEKDNVGHSLGHFWLRVLLIPNEEGKTVLLRLVWVCFCAQYIRGLLFFFPIQNSF